MDRDELRNHRYRRVLTAAMVLSLGAHGALFALGGLEVELPGHDVRDDASAPVDGDTFTEPPMQVVQLSGSPAAPEAAGNADASEAARAVQLPTPSQDEVVHLASPSMQPVASDRQRTPRVALTATSATDPAVRAFRARMEARDDGVDYRAASRAAEDADGGDEGRGVVRGGFRGAGPGCDAPGTGGASTDRSPFPIGG